MTENDAKSILWNYGLILERFKICEDNVRWVDTERILGYEDKETSVDAR